MDKSQNKGVACSLQSFFVGLTCIFADVRKASASFARRTLAQGADYARTVFMRIDTLLAVLGSWRFVKAIALLLLASYGVASTFILANVIVLAIYREPIDDGQLLWSQVFGSIYVLVVLACLAVSICRRGKTVLEKQQAQALKF